MRQVKSSRGTAYTLLVLVLSCMFALVCMVPGMGSAWADDASEPGTAGYEQQGPATDNGGEQEGDGDDVTPGTPDASGDAEQPAAPGDGPASPDPEQPAGPDAPAAGNPDQPAAPAPGEPDAPATGNPDSPAQPDVPATPDNSAGIGSDQPSAPGEGAASGADKPAEGDGNPADKPADKDDAADKPAGDTEADDAAPVAPVELVNFAYASHAAPVLGDKVPFVVALQDENAQPAKGVLTVRGALGDVTFESTHVDGRFLVFDLATESLGVGQAQLVQLEVTYADESRGVVDFLADGAAYVIEVAQEAPEAADAGAEGASDAAAAADPTVAQEASAQGAAGKMNLPADARLWLFQKDEPAKVFDGPAIEIEQAVAEKLLALGFGEFEVAPVPAEIDALAASKPYLYKDTPANEWYVTEGWLDYVSSSGLMTGYTTGADAGNFGPQDQISRAQVLVILYRYANPSSDATTNPSSYGKTSHFYDVPTGEYFTAAVEWAYQNGITTGYIGTGLFGPNDPVTRQDLATMLHRFAKGCGVGGNLGNISSFPDANEVNAYAWNAMRWANGRGIITGDKTQTPARLKPQANTTRAEAAKMFTVLVRDTLDGAQLQGPAWTYSSLSTPNHYLIAGGNIIATPQVSGSTSDLTYEYGWYNTAGETWRSGSKKDASFSFYLGGSGTFTLWCQVTDSNGISRIQTAEVIVWQALAPTATDAWDMHTWTIGVNHTAPSNDGFTFEYVWKKGMYEDTATTLGREKSTSTSKTVWLDSDGFYWLYAKVTDPEGHQSYAGTRVKVISGDSVYVYNKIRNLTSPTEWLLAVDTESCLVGVYYKMPYGWEEGALWLCSPGTYYTPTVTGLFSVGSRGYYFDSYGVRCYYWTQFYGDYLFHSTTYSTNGSPIDTRLGMHLSHGCVRLEISNARWIYETIPSGTTVLVY